MRQSIKQKFCALCKSPSKAFLCDSCRIKRNARDKRRRNERRKNGQCIICSKPTGGRARCERCLVTARRNQKKVTVRKNIKKLCIRCENNRIANSTLCREHFREHEELVKYRLDNKLCTICGKMARQDKRICLSCATIKHKSKTKMKSEALLKYGGECECCSIKDFEFLTIDHIDGNGNKHRKEMLGNFDSIYPWLRRNNYPSGFRVLCFNCNVSRGLFPMNANAACLDSRQSPRLGGVFLAYSYSTLAVKS